MNFIRPLLQLLAAMTLASCATQGAWARTLEERFANGLRVIVKEDRRAPTVVQQVWYRVGSIDEQVGITGVAHVLEHMMFKGTRRFGPGEFSRLITEQGGRENAFTARDATVYFQQVPNGGLALAMRLEADRMAHLALPAAEFAKEIRVVMEERRMRTEDEPRSLVEEDLMASAFSANSYGWPVIGWMNDLRNMTVADVRGWYRRWYAPNNALVVIVGDVDADKVMRLARNTYAKAAARPLPARKPLIEPQQRGLRRVNVKAPAQEPYLLLGYKVPTVANAEHDWEPYALEVLAAVLAGYDAARLNQQLVRERRIAHTAGAWYDGITRGPGMLFLEGVPAGETAVLEAALRSEAARLAAQPVGEDELERAKTQVLAREIYARDSLFRQAMQMGQFEAAGLSWRDADRVPERLRSVTAQQVREVAAHYLSDDRLTIGMLDPQPAEPGVSRARARSGERAGEPGQR